jgi:hypothetical protein
MSDIQNKQIDYSYYYTLFDFDSKYYKLYDEYMYKHEKTILDLYNGVILVDEFNLDEEKYKFQILGDYYRYFKDDNNKASEYYVKAIEKGNTICKIKDIITCYKKGSIEYYEALFHLLQQDAYASEYISNIFTSNVDKEVIDMFIDRIKKYIKTFIPNKNNNYYYLLKSSYEYYIKDYDNYVITVKQGIIAGNYIVLCNFISNYYYTDKELVWKYINIYLEKEEENNFASEYIKMNNEIKQSIVYINLFIICKIEKKYDDAINYLIKLINVYNKSEYNDISVILANTEYNSLLDILFDNFHLVKLNVTYLKIIDFRLLNLLANYYYKIDPIKYKHNYNFVQFYKDKLMNIYQIINNLEIEQEVNNDKLDIKFTDKIINANYKDIRYKEASILDYLVNLFNNEDYDFYKLMRETSLINIDMISETEKECIICYEEYNCLIKTKCNHLMCSKCLSSILNISPSGEICPYCRQSIFV